MRLRMSAYTSDPNLLAEFQRNLPGLEKFLRSNGAQVALRIDSIEDDGRPLAVAVASQEKFNPKMIEDMKRHYERR